MSQPRRLLFQSANADDERCRRHPACASDFFPIVARMFAPPRLLPLHGATRVRQAPVRDRGGKRLWFAEHAYRSDRPLAVVSGIHCGSVADDCGGPCVLRETVVALHDGLHYRGRPIMFLVIIGERKTEKNKRTARWERAFVTTALDISSPFQSRTYFFITFLLRLVVCYGERFHDGLAKGSERTTSGRPASFHGVSFWKSITADGVPRRLIRLAQR